MKNINKEGISEYVFTQLKKGNFKHWNEETLELDSLTLVDYINMKETTVKEYINSLINETTLKKSKKDINFEIFYKLCKKTILKQSILNCVEEIFWDDDSYNYNFKLDVMYSVLEILLYSIFEHLSEYHKLSDIEIDSFLIFGKNLFCDI